MMRHPLFIWLSVVLPVGDALVIRSSSFAPRPAAGTLRASGGTACLSQPEGAEVELLRLCALTDRGQKCTAEQKRALRDVIRQLEEHAPATDASALNGEWRLLAACGESTYRSSPFFWAVLIREVYRQ